MNKTDFLNTGTGTLRLIFFPIKEPAKRMGKNNAEISKVRIVNKPQKPYPAKAITEVAMLNQANISRNSRLPTFAE